jgi:CelD/BcsL family acetyltransferase involved in cellulose biosynthesis
LSLSFHVYDELGGLETVWADLAMHCETPFAGWAWAQAVSAHAPKNSRLFIVLERRNGQPVCIAPWRRRQLHGATHIEALGTEFAPDHVGLIGAPTDTWQIAAHLGRWLLEQPWHSLNIDGLPAGCLAVAQLHEALASSGLTTRLIATHIAPFRDALDGPLLSDKRARKLRWEARQLDAAGVIIRTSNRLEGGARLRALHADRWGPSSVVDVLLAFEAAGGALTVYRAEAGEALVGAAVTLHSAHTHGLYTLCVDRSAVTKVSLGNHLVLQALTVARDAGCVAFDLLRGAHGYKLRWATGARRMVRLEVDRRHPAVQISRAIEGVKAVARSAIRGAGALPKRR